MTYGENIPFVRMLGDYFGADDLGTLAAEGIDWVWQHRLTQFEEVGLSRGSLRT